MNCLHCQKNLPVDFSGNQCPFCGKDLAPAGLTAAPLPDRVAINWSLFFLILFLPPVGSFVAVALNMGGLTMLFGLLGSLVSGVLCTRIAMANLAATGARRVLLYIVVGILLCGLSFFVSGLGCAAGAGVSRHHF